MTADPKKSLRFGDWWRNRRAICKFWDAKGEEDKHMTTWFQAMCAGYQQGIEAERKRCIAELRHQFEHTQPGTLVSYHIAAEVLRTNALLPPSERTEEQEGGSDEVETN